LYDICIEKGKELIGTQIDLTHSALVRSRTGGNDRCEEDPGRLESDLELNFEYVLEDIMMHLFPKESPHLVG
jgi:hypothetical protein